MSLFDRFRSTTPTQSPKSMKDSDQQPQQPPSMTSAKSETAMSDSVKSQTALSKVAEAFEELADHLKNSTPKRRIKVGESQSGEDEGGEEEEEVELRLDFFCQACSLVSVLFSSLGLAFKFAETEYGAKVRDLVEASKTFDNLQSVVDVDVAKGTVKTAGSHTRNLRRVRQGLDLIRGIFEQFLVSNDNSLKDAATTAYAQICAPYHTWAIRTAVYAGMYTLPTRDQLLARLEEDEQSAEKKMRRYIQASLPVIQYIDRLYISRNITLDW
ncbi:ACD11 homolog protein [Linum perenne]